MKIKTEIKKLMKTFGKGGRVLDRIYTFNFPHAKFTWEEKRALLWLLKTKVFETPEKVYTTWLGSYWGGDSSWDSWGIEQEYHHPEDEPCEEINSYYSDILDFSIPIIKRYTDLMVYYVGHHWGLIRGGLRGVYVINHLNNVEGFERKPTNFEILASSTEAKEYEIKIEGDRA